MEYREIRCSDLVRWNGRIYGVWDDGWDEQSARLLPLDAVIRYEGDEEAADAQAVAAPYRQMERIEPAEADAETVRALFRLDVMPWELAQQGRYPFSSATHRCAITEEDLLCLIDRLPRFRNVFLLEAWRSSFQGQGTHDHLRFPDLSEENLLLNLLAERFLYMMEWLDPEEKDWLYILPLRDAYVQSRGKPIREAEIPEDFMDDLLSTMEHLAKQGGISERLRAYYTRVLEERCLAGGFDDIQRYAYAYYGGNGIVPCDWRKAEQALLRLFNPDEELPQGDAFAANSLGYIYYSNRLGNPDCEKAFRCFSYAAEHGVTEAIYKLSDMYRKGDGTPQDKEKAWTLLSGLWKHTNKRNISCGKYADIALRMGYCWRDGVGVSPDPEKALAFFLKAQKAITARLKEHPGFGDETVASNIEKAIASISGGKKS